MTVQPLHLLIRQPRFIDGRPVNPESFRRYIAWCYATGRLFGAWTSRTPRRIDELSGGSVYFLRRNEILFRLPFHGLEPVATFRPDAHPRFRGHTAIVCTPRLTPVHPSTVARMHGWRYLTHQERPPDLDQTPPASPSSRMEHALESLGLFPSES